MFLELLLHHRDFVLDGWDKGSETYREPWRVSLLSHDAVHVCCCWGGGDDAEAGEGCDCEGEEVHCRGGEVHGGDGGSAVSCREG